MVSLHLAKIPDFTNRFSLPGFESLMINEFHGRDFPCVSFIPSYGSGLQRSCSTVGSVPGQDFVNGDIYINTAYAYQHSHKWR